MHHITGHPPNTAMIRRYEGHINPSDFHIQSLMIFSCPRVSSKLLFELKNLRKKLHPRTNSHNIQAATNTVAPLLTFYKNFILKIQALYFELYNRFTSPASQQNYFESACHLRQLKPRLSYSLS